MNDDNVDEEMSRSIDVPEINNDEQLKQFIKKFLMRTEGFFYIKLKNANFFSKKISNLFFIALK